MPTVSQVIKFRNRRRNRDKNRPWGRLGLILGIMLSLMGAITSLAVIWLYSAITQDLPSSAVLTSLVDPPNGSLNQPTRLYDRTKDHVIFTLENPAIAGRQYLFVNQDSKPEKDQFSDYLVDATIVIFDSDFWKHSGYSSIGWSTGSHPTLAQRLISDLVIDTEPASLKRNIRERLLAAQITAEFGRDKILEWYLNTAQYGELIYGADAAAHVYFGKSAATLSLAEAAMLTAIGETPTMTPLHVTQLLKQQQAEVIHKMLDDRLITEDEAQRALNEVFQFKKKSEAYNFAPAFTELVLHQLSQVLTMDRIKRGGYEIITTLDYDMQLEATCASKIQVDRIQGNPDSLPTEDIESCKTAQLLPTLQLDEGIFYNDINTEVVIIDPRSGQILTYAGDANGSVEPIFTIRHPAGTILSPFLYVTAFARGLSPASLLWDIPSVQASEHLEPGQYDLIQGISPDFHGPVRARVALANDYLAATESVLKQVRAENVWLTEKRFGITIPEFEIAADQDLDGLYSQESTILDIVSAYSVLANQGIMIGQRINESESEDEVSLDSASIIRVTGVDGRVWLDWSVAQSRSIISPQLTYLLTHSLSDESAKWPSLGHPNPLEIGRPVASKIGMTETGDNAWTVGYTDKLAVGVWLGQTQEDSSRISQDFSAGLWHAIMQNSSSHDPIQKFTMPGGISLVQVCDPSGMLVSELCPTIVQEVFLKGNEPTQEDNLYQKFQINRETGLLATVFTLPEEIEEKVFLVVPPQAVDWARNTGLPIPPDTYDAIYPAESTSKDVQIATPQIFEHLAGQVQVLGSAAGADFSFFRLQVGQGLNPQQWLQIGDDIDTPIQDGLLGIWNTDGLEGLFVIQLLVVRQDQRIDRAIIQVTIDNTPPHVEILTPAEGERIKYDEGEKMIIQVDADDNLDLERIEFYVDGQLKSTLMKPPLIILWPMEVGKHYLYVKAYDLAGNRRGTSISFMVERK